MNDLHFISDDGRRHMIVEAVGLFECTPEKVLEKQETVSLEDEVVFVGDSYVRSTDEARMLEYQPGHYVNSKIRI